MRPLLSRRLLQNDLRAIFVARISRFIRAEPPLSVAAFAGSDAFFCVPSVLAAFFVVYLLSRMKMVRDCQWPILMAT